MKRRSFLKGSLTLVGLSALGCTRSGSKPPVLQGQRRDPNFPVGHRLRDGDLPLEPQRWEKCEGVILGGGVAGLSAGWRWSHAGLQDYRLLELESELGGNSRCLDYPESKAPIGAHYLPIPNLEARAVRRLLREMDVLRETESGLRLAEEVLCHSRQERLFYGGRWHEGLVPKPALSSESLAQWAAFQAHIQDWKNRRDTQGQKVFALPLAFSSQETEFLALDQVSFADYAADQGWTDPFLLWMLNYACRDDFGGTVENCSAWAGLHYFASRDGGGLGDPDHVLVWPEGNYRLASFLRDNQAGEIRSRSLVTKVRPQERGLSVDYLDLESQELVRLEAQVGVFCLPAFLRSRVLDPGHEGQGFEYQPWLTVNLVLDREPLDLEGPGRIAWDNVIFESESLGYVVATHQSLRVDPTRATVWTWYRPFPERSPREVREELLKTEWAEWKELVLGELEAFHPDIRQRCQRLDVTVLGHGMVRPKVGFLWGEDLARAREPLGRLFFGHGDLSGMSLFEESQFRGVKAAEDALAALKKPVESFL